MNHNILITSAGKRVALVQYFKETLSRLFPDAKVYTTDLNPEMAPAGYVSDGCIKVPRVTDSQYVDELKRICVKYLFHSVQSICQRYDDDNLAVKCTKLY